MKKISLQEIYNKYLGKVSFPDTTIIFFYEDKDISFNEIRDDILIDACNNIKKENLTKHNSSSKKDCIMFCQICNNATKHRIIGDRYYCHKCSPS